MKTVTITEARRELPGLMQAGEPVAITRRGELVGVLRAERRNAAAAHDRQMQARLSLAELAEKLAAESPTVEDPELSASEELRRMRESGRY